MSSDAKTHISFFILASELIYAFSFLYCKFRTYSFKV